jgi:hypothetical protein
VPRPSADGRSAAPDGIEDFVGCHIRGSSPVPCSLTPAEAARACCFTVVMQGYRLPMFFFFSNRLGCLGSLLVSVLATVVLLLIFVL